MLQISAGYEAEEEMLCSACGVHIRPGEVCHDVYEDGLDTGNVLCEECADGYPLVEDERPWGAMEQKRTLSPPQAKSEPSCLQEPSAKLKKVGQIL